MLPSQWTEIIQRVKKARDIITLNSREIELSRMVFETYGKTFSQIKQLQPVNNPALKDMQKSLAIINKHLNIIANLQECPEISKEPLSIQDLCEPITK